MGPRGATTNIKNINPAQVRLAWLRCVGDWMLNLRERIDHEPRLMPYALSALDDEAPQVRGCGVEVAGGAGGRGRCSGRCHVLPLSHSGRFWPFFTFCFTPLFPPCLVFV
jgi:hypothetical protein